VGADGAGGQKCAAAVIRESEKCSKGDFASLRSP
jgi:hypothetical protein